MNPFCSRTVPSNRRCNRTKPYNGCVACRIVPKKKVLATTIMYLLIRPFYLVRLILFAPIYINLPIGSISSPQSERTPSSLEQAGTIQCRGTCGVKPYWWFKPPPVQEVPRGFTQDSMRSPRRTKPLRIFPQPVILPSPDGRLRIDLLAPRESAIKYRNIAAGRGGRRSPR